MHGLLGCSRLVERSIKLSAASAAGTETFMLRPEDVHALFQSSVSAWRKFWQLFGLNDSGEDSIKATDPRGGEDKT